MVIYIDSIEVCPETEKKNVTEEQYSKSSINVTQW